MCDVVFKSFQGSVPGYCIACASAQGHRDGILHRNVFIAFTSSQVTHQQLLQQRQEQHCQQRRRRRRQGWRRRRRQGRPGAVAAASSELEVPEKRPAMLRSASAVIYIQTVAPRQGQAATPHRAYAMRVRVFTSIA